MNTPAPINPTRQALLEHGLKLAQSKGLRGITVRELAANAGVNLGSFVYHFGTREQFIAQLVELWYQPLYETIRHVALDGQYESAYERLQATMQQFIRLIGENAAFVRHVLADALAGEAAAHAFLLSLKERHPKLLLQLIQQAQQEGSLIAEPPLHLLVFVMSAVQTPVIAGSGLMANASWLPAIAQMILQMLASPEAAQKRLQWALNGIRLPATCPPPSPLAAQGNPHE